MTSDDLWTLRSLVLDLRRQSRVPLRLDHHHCLVGMVEQIDTSQRIHGLQRERERERERESRVTATIGHINSHAVTHLCCVCSCASPRLSTWSRVLCQTPAVASVPVGSHLLCQPLACSLTTSWEISPHPVALDWRRIDQHGIELTISP